MLTHTLQGEPKNFLAFAFFSRAVDDGFVEKESDGRDAVFVFGFFFFFAPLILTIGRNETNGVVSPSVFRAKTPSV